MTTTPSRRRPGPSPRRLKTPRLPDVAIVGETPLAELRIYESTVLLTRRTGPSWRQYPVDPDQIATLLGRLPSVSGLLPQGTLGTGQLAGAPFYVVYVPPRTARIQTTAQTYAIPLPPLVWCGHKRDYRIWALGTTDYPTRDLPLYRAPFPNCYASGQICWGNVGSLPQAGPKTLDAVLTLFLEESAFNAHVANGKSIAFPTSVIARWQDLVDTAAEAYPLDDLLPAELSLSWALSGKTWGGAR